MTDHDDHAMPTPTDHVYEAFLRIREWLDDHNDAEAEALADTVYASPDVHHQDDNISWSRRLNTLCIEQDGGGLLDLVDITTLSDDFLHSLADMDGERLYIALAPYVYWSRQ